MSKQRKLTGKGPHVDLQSEGSKLRTSGITSQDELNVPGLTRDRMPEADRPNFRNGVYAGTGTGAGIGGSTDTGGADTMAMEDQPRMGTTGDTRGKAVAGGDVGRSSAMSDDDARLDDQEEAERGHS